MTLRCLPVETILHVSCTCHELHVLANDSCLWQHLCHRDFGESNLLCVSFFPNRFVQFRMQGNQKFATYLSVYQNIEVIKFMFCGVHVILLAHADKGEGGIC